MLEPCEYRHGDLRLIGQLARPGGSGLRPGVLVMHDARGQNAQVRERAGRGGIQAHVVACFGGKDPYAPPEHIDAFRAEMAAAGATCDVTVFGDALHAFTDPLPRRMDVIPEVGYDPLADAVSWAGTVALLEQVLG